ncbi:MAG: cytochrome c biogenesis protein CcdA [Nitrososphaerota archaeon]|nr:cytochrome c biogenesis protein CcdA [Nitrososphaerota archaeon]
MNLIQKSFWSFLKFVFSTFIFLALTIFTSALPQSLTIYYFVAEGCEHCIKVDNYINSIKIKYPDVIFKRLDILNNNTNTELFIVLAEDFNIREEDREVPVVFLGDMYLIGEEDIIQKLEKLIIEYKKGEYYDRAGEIIKRFLEREHALSLPSLVSVIVAAFVDSLNPCAFATIVMLLTYSVSQGFSRRMLLNCGAFIIGVLISYLSAGIGLLYLLNITSFRIFLRYLVGLIAISFATLELKEFLLHGKGISLEQSNTISMILNRYSTSTTVGVGFLIGMAVSMIELPCTGGIYITILYLLSKIGFTLEVFLLLLLYNLIFVLPLIIIVILVYLGSKSVLEIDAWRIEKRRFMRLMAGVLLLVVGVAIIIGLI